MERNPPVTHERDLDGSTSSKVKANHLDRLAVVYVRQSTMNQVQNHQESTKVQYGLVNKARQLGWPQERILVIDSDLGISGASADDRPGFQRLLSELALNHVGFVLGAEMSRLARSCKDWYHLLELCAVFDVLICDSDGIYDPTSYNDRLLLGLKGTMSEAELHILKQRMWQGTLEKARRGDLVTQVPMGYIRNSAGEVMLDPDEQVRGTIHLIFQSYDRLGTIQGVLKEFRKTGVSLPVRVNRGPAKGQLDWRVPSQTTLRNILSHPIYAGAYSYGRTCQNPRQRLRDKKTKYLPRSEWRVLLRDRYPAYITWEQYERNAMRLAQNRSRYDSPGSVRSGRALLAGLVICGRCGYRMFTQYCGKASQPRYQCSARRVVYGDEMCQGLAARALDEELTRLVLLSLTPSAIELSIQVAADLRCQRHEADQQWQHRMERAAYEVDRARRQYAAVEPENRLVARTLEANWETALLAQRSLIEEYERHQLEMPATLTADEAARIQALAANIPAIWNASTTTDADRKEIIRQVVDRVVINVEGESEWVEARIHWAGGHETYTRFRRPVARVDQLSNWDTLHARIRELKLASTTIDDMIQSLNREGFRSAKGKPFTRGSLSILLLRCDLASSPSATSNASSDEWSIAGLSRELQVGYPTVHQWIQKGTVKAEKRNGRWVVHADHATRRQLVKFQHERQRQKAKHEAHSPKHKKA
jgi:DNA invertase Pin-like site-specific DNA recombinase